MTRAQRIRDVLAKHPGGLTTGQVVDLLGADDNSNNVSATLAEMMGRGVVIREGEPRRYRYTLKQRVGSSVEETPAQDAQADAETNSAIPAIIAVRETLRPTLGTPCRATPPAAPPPDYAEEVHALLAERGPLTLKEVMQALAITRGLAVGAISELLGSERIVGNGADGGSVYQLAGSVDAVEHAPDEPPMPPSAPTPRTDQRRVISALHHNALLGMALQLRGIASTAADDGEFELLQDLAAAGAALDRACARI